jgi:hypothetical protein
MRCNGRGDVCHRPYPQTCLVTNSQGKLAAQHSLDLLCCLDQLVGLAHGKVLA